MSERYQKMVLLHSNDMHGDFLAEQVDDRLIGGLSLLSGYLSKVKSEKVISFALCLCSSL